MPKRSGASIDRLFELRHSNDYEPQTGSGVEPLIKWILIGKENPFRSLRLNALEQWLTFDIEHNLSNLIELPHIRTYAGAIDNAFAEAMSPFIDSLRDNDRIGFYIESNDLNYHIYLRPEKPRPFDKERFLNQIFLTSQSNKSFLNSGHLKVRVLIIYSLFGSGRTNKAPISYAQSVQNKQSVIKIKNNDHSCGYRAIAMGIKYHEWNVKGHTQQLSKWHHLVTRETTQKTNGKVFCKTYGLDFNKPVDIDILKKIDSKIDYQIIVIKNCLQMFVGTDRPKVIYLLYDGTHYDLIKTMTGFLGRNIYCKYCNKGYRSAIQHRCEKSCYLCRGHNICPPGTPTKCDQCDVTYVSKECFDQHLASNVCKDRHFCPECEVVYTVDKKHKHNCNEMHCNSCNQYYTVQPHFYHMSPTDMKKIAEEDKKNKILIAYDIECMLENNNNTYSHSPILLISHTVCDKCEAEGCDICVIKEKVFYGQDCVERFVEDLLDFAKVAEKEKASITAFAHNNSGYDGHWILRELMRRDLKNIEPILKGTKIMKLDIGNIRFIDSLLLFQRPLADLPKMFGFEGEAKGFFPHFANTPQNQELKCHLRDISLEDFGRNQMTTKRATEFDEWYATNANNTYELKGEIEKYCRSDVHILLEAMIRFRKLFSQTTGVDPLTRSFTLASIGMEFFRAKILLPGVIGITPIGGYNNMRKQSFEANAWMDVMEKKYNCQIVREYKIGKYFADGAIDGKFNIDGQIYTKIVFEYNGCYYHGHCQYNDPEKMAKVETKRQYYLKHGFYPIFVWECEWETSPDATQEYYNRLNYHKNMKQNNLFCDPRKALNGGRTNNLKFSHIAAENEEIRYLDFTSLYPYVLSHRSFPASHPKIFKNNFPDIDTVFGFVSCKVLPPKNLYLPVLPYNSKGKLTFPLCRTCTDNRNNNSCHHSIDDRCLIGTFVSEELQKAIQLGYEIKETYEILHYEQKIDDLFKKYINVWYKIKAEASGYPANCQTPEDKEKYLQKFESVEKFALDPTKVESNPGLRTTAKLMLNSFWGKLAQKPNLPQTKIIKEFDELWDSVNDLSIEWLGDILIEELMLLSFKYKDPQDARVGHTAVAIAAFVTAYARLKLYDELERIETSSPGSVLYFDTDSIVFAQKPETDCPKIGNSLGMMTDEVKEEYGMSAKMTEFHSTGPKSYAYKIETPNGEKYSLKAKGLSQTINAQNVLNFELIKSMAIDKAENKPTGKASVPQQQFRTSKQHIVTSTNIEKRFEVTSDKRIVIDNNTLPYGYIDEDVDEHMEEDTDEDMDVDVDEEVDEFANLMI